MGDKKYVLAINPGSTSTKIAIFKNEELIYVQSLSHSNEEIKKYNSIYEQKDMREKAILDWVSEKSIKLQELLAVVGRGGLLRPMPGGTYEITEAMLYDLKTGYQGHHASNLGGIIAYDIAKKVNIPSFIVDPVAVDEIIDEARISGLSEIPRRSLVHALNVKAVTRKVCEKINKPFESSSFVVAHMGGGITISPVKNGRILDCNNSNEEGPFTPERAGGLPVGDLIKLAYSGKYTEKEMKARMLEKSGLMGYLGTNDAREVDKMIENGDERAELILKSMAYQIGKEIGAMSTVLNGQIDAIILTGGLAYSKRLTRWIIDMVDFIASVELVPGENELLALAKGALRIIQGKEKAKIYEEEVQI